MVATHDYNIRKALHSTELQQYKNDPESLVLDEFALTEEDVRIDIAVVNGAFHGFEIKSDSDTLDRLPNQADAYSRVFDLLWIVCGQRYSEKVEEILPAYWGIMVATSIGETVSIARVREATYNPEISSRAISRLLWREEALDLLSEAGEASGYRSKTRNVICDHLIEVMPHDILAPRVRSAIRKRTNWRVDSPRTQYADLRRSGPKSRSFREKNVALFLSRISADLQS